MVETGRFIRLARAGEVGANPDQRIHEDARRLSELSADLGIGLLQASLLLLSFLGVLSRAHSTFGFVASVSQIWATWCGARFSMLRAVRGSLGVLASPS
jgi:ABC-type uncharacterized transport system fused permease/ATPase subunit